VAGSRFVQCSISRTLNAVFDFLPDTVGRKKGATLFWAVTAMYLGGFFLYQWKEE